ncbi:hypothetical protein CO058_00290 [candidate division WWE3 bacterium CG_4_9_14_0_2_um_filter_35_11]|uniref:PIN domain-containing protein n=1 Tax=candidate division WWE3 bacterium CG_4_9_14_0_2_um_filter_35_11 TaxID=1975077 RepID=A0A2M8EMT4_UNCKA|nr:MAG: hypothetical protein COV25_00250 [candidate division WWE3 bacterium CG10_big_fil_rev_8_21_14_0_10_35_32]PJC24054.1 MAG: hypothetical protein CO058_00290 [candidate division WWE3 bacterium CG_4_9_14_0_2_um_filter_35_11]
MGIEETPKLFLDSSFVVALFYGDSVSVDKAQKVLPALITVDRIYINNYILSEVLTVLSQRIGKKKTKEGLNVLYNNRVELIHASRAVENRAYEEFFKISKKDISYADLMLTLHAKEKGIDAILTLDKHYMYLGQKYGLNIICP